MRLMIVLTSLLVFAAPVPGRAWVPERTGPDSLQSQALKIFLDGRAIEWDYIRTQIPFVNYVRDRTDADVHILITIKGTGSGGNEYAMAFIGQNDYADMSYTLRYFSNRTDVADEVRLGFVRCLKKGLLPFISRTPLSNKLDVVYDDKAPVPPAAVRDAWNYWIFSLNVSGSASGVKTRTGGQFVGNVSANRVTPDWKIRLGANMQFDATKYYLEDDVLKSTAERESFSGMVVKSLTRHWSAGVWLGISAATFSNIKLALSPSAAVEYSIFPYEDATRRKLYLQYRLSYNSYAYHEETIFDKLKETRWKQSLALILELTQPWGNAVASVRGSHCLDDASINRLELNGSLSFRVFRGFSFWVSGGYAAIHDQLSLPKAGATLDQILLVRKDQATTYSYGINVGLSFTFGSMYSNVVNPRFE
jgi:hypothetical protein